MEQSAQVSATVSNTTDFALDTVVWYYSFPNLTVTLNHNTDQDSESEYYLNTNVIIRKQWTQSNKDIQIKNEITEAKIKITEAATRKLEILNYLD